MVRIHATALGLAAVAVAMGQGPYLAVGEAAPNIEGTDAAGKKVSLAALRASKPVFLVFWKDRCPHNGRATALFNAMNKAYEGKAQLVGVVTSSEERLKGWNDRFAVNYPLLADPDKAIIKAYKLKLSITSMQIGTDGKIAKVFEGFGADSMKALNESMAAAAGVKPAEIDLSTAPKRLTWG